MIERQRQQQHLDQRAEQRQQTHRRRVSPQHLEVHVDGALEEKRRQEDQQPQMRVDGQGRHLGQEPDGDAGEDQRDGVGQADVLDDDSDDRRDQQKLDD